MSYLINNWEVKNVNWHDGRHGICPCIVDENKKLEIEIPNDKLKIFGYEVAGCEAGIVGYHRTDNKEEQIKALIDMLSENLINEIKEPKFWNIKKYLTNYKGKQRMGKFIEPPKNTILAINKTLSIMEDDWQEIYKMSVNDNGF